MNLVVLGIFAGSFLIQMIYWWLVHARLAWYRTGRSGIRKSPVSVVICAKNEEENLRKNLPFVLEQDYPEYEVIVVNDASSDDTEEVLREMKEKYPHLRTTEIMENDHIRSGKKLALTVGIKAAHNDWILLTDADCRMAGKKWLASMQRNFNNRTGIVLGYGGYKREKGLLNLVIRWDAFIIAMQYFGYALCGLAYMGVGRNLAYRRDLFFGNKGFASHYELASGDDDLFINEVAGKTVTGIEIRPESHTFSEAKHKWKDWYYQKKRHLSTGPRYRPITKFLLGFELMTRLAFYAGFAWLLSTGILLPWVLGVFLLRLLSTMLVIKLAMDRLTEKYLLLISPLLDLFLPLLFTFMAFSNYVAKKRARWT